jgi:hypothetical protein
MRYAIPENFEIDDWVFTEEFLRELVVAQLRHTQKLVGELKQACGIANSAMIR